MPNEKFKIPIIKLGNPFLPSPDEVSEFCALLRLYMSNIKVKCVRGKHYTPDRSHSNISKAGIHRTVIRQFTWQFKGVCLKRTGPECFSPKERLISTAVTDFAHRYKCLEKHRGLNSTN